MNKIKQIFNIIRSEPVVTINNYKILTIGLFDTLITSITSAAIWFVNHTDAIIFFSIAIANSPAIVRRPIVNKNNIEV